jgi:hypothetical protein
VGAEQFIDIGEGDSAADAFATLKDQAAYERGHGGYTGTIAEKQEFVTLEVPALAGATDEAIEAYVSAAMYGMSRTPDALAMVERVDDKWGPAGHIPLAGNRHLFFGWASS